MIVREFTYASRAGKQRAFSRGNRGTSGIINCRHLVEDEEREREREREIEKFFSLECTIALRLTVCSLVLLERRQRSLSRLVIFSSAERREARGFVLVARDKKDLGILGARCHRHSHRSHPIIFKLSKRALRPYIRPDNVSCVCEHVSK